MNRAAITRFAQEIREHHDDLCWFFERVLDRDPHPGQKKWLANSVRDENMLVTGNRWGKSEVAAGKTIAKAAFRKGWNPETRARMARMHQPYHAINVSITADQSRLVWFKAHSMLQSPKAKWLVRSIKMTPFPRIELINGAIIEARSTSNNGERLLGNVYDHVNWDEAAYEKKFTYILENVLRMRVLDRAGVIDYTSTGNGRNDFGLQFLRALSGKDPEVYAQTGSTFENPFVDHARLEKNMRRMPEYMRRQNIGGEIVEGGGTFFPTDDINAAIDPDLDVRVILWDEEEQEAHAIVYVDGKGEGEDRGGIEWIAKFPSHLYVHGWDLADKQDWCVGTTWDVSTKPKTMVEFERFRRVGWSRVWDRIRVRDNKYPGKTYVDSTGVGDVAVDELRDIGAEGVKFSGRNVKDALLGNVQSLLSMRELRVPSIRVWENEMRWYERDDEDLVTDCVMSTVVAGVGMKRGHGEFYIAEV